MKQIKKKGSYAIKKFKCGHCKTIFLSDEYEIGRGTGCVISECPTCHQVAYKCFFQNIFGYKTQQ